MTQNSNKIKISIATVCYNASNTIEATIQSVLSQDYLNLEYIIIDGSSSDGTIDILKKYDDNLKFISEHDSGVYDAMNKALNFATGDFILFLGADDVLYSNDTITKVVKNISNNDIIYYGDVIRINDGRVYDGKFSKWDWGYKNICHQCIFYPSKIYKFKKYDMNYELVADWVYNLQLIADKYTFEYIDIIVSKYNDIDGLSSTRKDERFLYERKHLIIDAVGVLSYLWGNFVKLKGKLL